MTNEIVIIGLRLAANTITMKCSRHNSLLTYNYLLVLAVVSQKQSKVISIFCGSDTRICAPNRLSAGASPQTPLGELTAFPQIPWLVYWVGPPGEGKEGREGEKREGGGYGRGREGRESRNALIQSWQA